MMFIQNTESIEIEALQEQVELLREALEDLRFAGLLDGISTPFRIKIDEAIDATKPQRGK